MKGVFPLVETESNGDSKSPNERGLSTCWFVGLVVPVQETFILPWLPWFFSSPYIISIYLSPPHRPANWAGSRAGPPVSEYVSPAHTVTTGVWHG